MYLSLSETIKVDSITYTILDKMSYFAYKLWNISNYEKMNYKELGFDKFPDWKKQRSYLKDNFFYKMLPSQTAQNVLSSLDEGWKSFFELKKNNSIENPKPPKFKREHISITFSQNGFRLKNGTLRLTISSGLRLKLKELDIYNRFIFLDVKKLDGLDVKEIYIKVLSDNKIKLIATYKISDVEIKPDNSKYLSIDLGVKNSFTCYDNRGKSFIISGFLNITHLYDKKIAYYQEVNSKQQYNLGVKYPKPSKKILSMYKNKKNRVNNFIHQASRYIANYCIDNNINTVVIGDIKGIRDNCDIGINNQGLHSFPYNKIYSMLEYKLKLAGIRMVKQKEYYTSKCSPLSKRVNKTYSFKSGKRIKRGLYKDQNYVFNADSVGAYNILRLYAQKNKLDINIPLSGLSNPQRIIF